MIFISTDSCKGLSSFLVFKSMFSLSYVFIIEGIYLKEGGEREEKWKMRKKWVNRGRDRKFATGMRFKYSILIWSTMNRIPFYTKPTDGSNEGSVLWAKNTHTSLSQFFLTLNHPSCSMVTYSWYLWLIYLSTPNTTYQNLI